MLFLIQGSSSFTGNIVNEKLHSNKINCENVIKIPYDQFHGALPHHLLL
jgi:hypothetical protein